MEVRDAAARREKLVEFFQELRDCQKCALAGSRTQVVFGNGNADAVLMFVGEAPGVHEDQQGKPFVGRAGKLLDTLLGEIGLERKQCFVANVLKCRPPGNRDPEPVEIDACKGHLFQQIDLIQPRVVCTLGNFATKLLSGRPDGITKVRGIPQVCELGGQTVFLYPIFHPAAALRTPAVLEQLRVDFQKLPELLATEKPVPSPVPEPQREAVPEPTAPLELVASGQEAPPREQLGLF
jgi:uracil-DNA glycosylase family 4